MFNLVNKRRIEVEFFCIDTKLSKTVGYKFLWQDRLGGAICLTDG